jgi:hypothetical protein
MSSIWRSIPLFIAIVLVLGVLGFVFLPRINCTGIYYMRNSWHVAMRSPPRLRLSGSPDGAARNPVKYLLLAFSGGCHEQISNRRCHR